MGRATNSAIQASANKPEPYSGEIMIRSMLTPSDFEHACAVIVTGDGLNFCGHTLIHTKHDWYFHVSGRYDYPRFMHEDGYKRYLKENEKREIRRWIVPIRDPAAAHRKLEELLAKQWFWGGAVHNCVSFVEEIVRAGGSKAGMMMNCPRAEPFA